MPTTRRKETKPRRLNRYTIHKNKVKRPWRKAYKDREKTSRRSCGTKQKEAVTGGTRWHAVQNRVTKTESTGHVQKLHSETKGKKKSGNEMD